MPSCATTTHMNANIHRGVHTLSVRATEAHDAARQTVKRFLNAADTREIIFVRGATEAINLVAQTYGRVHVGAGDEVLITAMEHHSNIVPWQILCEEKGAHLKVAPIDDRGELLLDEFEKLIGPRTKIVAVTHVSNALGTLNPLREMIEMAHRRGVPVLVDGAQAVPHFAVDVQALDCDFYAFSGHKVYGPTGIGVLYGKRALLDAMPPYQGGGDMISSVTFEKTTYNVLPFKFEAGTPDIAGAIALGAALEYIAGMGMDKIAAHESELLAYATECSRRDSRHAPHRNGARARRRRSRLCSTACIRTTWERFSTAKALPSAPATTARSRSWSASAFPPRRGHRSPSTTRRKKSTRWSREFARRARCLRERGKRRTRRSLPGSDSGAQQGSAEFPQAG